MEAHIDHFGTCQNYSLQIKAAICWNVSLDFRKRNEIASRITTKVTFPPLMESKLLEEHYPGAVVGNVESPAY